MEPQTLLGHSLAFTAIERSDQPIFVLSLSKSLTLNNGFGRDCHNRRTVITTKENDFFPFIDQVYTAQRYERSEIYARNTNTHAHTRQIRNLAVYRTHFFYSECRLKGLHISYME